MLTVLAAPSLALTAGEKCAADKLKTAGKYGSCRLAAEAKATKKAEAPEFTKCERKFSDKWQKAEAKAGGSCPATADEGAVEWRIRDEADELALQITGVEPELPPANPWDWPEATILAVEIDIDPGAASDWLPAGVTLTTPPVATVFVAHYPNSACCGPYNEAAVLVHVMHDSVEKRHCAWMLVDDDVALILGREMGGFPKKIGRIAVEVAGSTVTARVRRGGATLLSATGTLGAPVASPAPLFGIPFVNVFGPALALFGLEPLKLIGFEVSEEIIEAIDVDVELSLPGSVGDPIGQIEMLGVRGATLYRDNFGNANPATLTLDPFQESPAGYLGRTWQLRQGNPAP
jgi:acetoacetate decarboxylase